MNLPGTDYELKTTFWMDFSIADRFGAKAVRDTYQRAFDEWKDNYIYLTELVLVLNHKCWEWYRRDNALCDAYYGLYWMAAGWAEENLVGEEARRYYFRTVD